MRKELDYFTIDGAFGGSQGWFTNVVMNIGGCAAATACDSSIYFAKYNGMKDLYPFDINHITKEDYKKFSQKMKPYIRPRVSGVKKLEWYIDGYQKYIEDVNRVRGKQYKIKMQPFDGHHSCEEAADKIRKQLDADLPVPYLMLRHRNEEKYKDFIWHWFLLVGYEEAKEDVIIFAATYGEAHRLSLKEFWDTGYEERGGIILYQ